MEESDQLICMQASYAIEHHIPAQGHLSAGGMGFAAFVDSRLHFAREHQRVAGFAIRMECVESRATRIAWVDCRFGGRADRATAHTLGDCAVRQTHLLADCRAEHPAASANRMAVGSTCARARRRAGGITIPFALARRLVYFRPADYSIGGVVDHLRRDARAARWVGCRRGGSAGTCVIGAVSRHAKLVRATGRALRHQFVAVDLGVQRSILGEIF